MRCKRTLTKLLLTILLPSVASFHVYADSLSGYAASVVDALPEGLQLAVNTSYTYDSNLFRLSASAPGYPVRYDTTRTIQADLSYNQTYGMQNFTLDTTIAHNRFTNFSNLDYDSKGYKGTWAWRVDKDLSGTIGATQNQTMPNYATIQTQVKTITTTQSRFVNGDWLATSYWHALAGISENQTSYSALIAQIQGSKGTSLNAGFLYENDAMDTISFKQQNTQGSYTDRPIDYVNLNDNGYTETDDLLDFKWVLSGKSQLTGELNHLSVNQNHFSQRNYSGMAGNVSYLWAVSGKSTIQFTAQRNFSQYLSVNSSYAVTDDFSISPFWQVSGKLSMHATIDQARVSYLGAINGAVPNGHSDTTRTIMLSADWAASRTITLHTSIQHINRYSYFTANQFGDNSVNVTGQIIF